MNGSVPGGGACIMFIHLLVFVEYIEQLFIVLAADSLVSLCGYLLMDHRHELQMDRRDELHVDRRDELQVWIVGESPQYESSGLALNVSRRHEPLVRVVGMSSN